MMTKYVKSAILYIFIMRLGDKMNLSTFHTLACVYPLL